MYDPLMAKDYGKAIYRTHVAWTRLQELKHDGYTVSYPSWKELSAHQQEYWRKLAGAVLENLPRHD